MSLADHHEKQTIQGGDTVKEIVIDMAEGLTVPFALTADISGAVAQTHLVVTAGFAEIAAGSIAMGLGGYWPLIVTVSIFKARSAAKSNLSSLPDLHQRIEEQPDGRQVLPLCRPVSMINPWP